MKHPSDDALQQWADGELDEGVAAVESHVGSCARCAAVVASVRQLGDGMRLWSDGLEVRSASMADAIMAEGRPSVEPAPRPALQALPGGRVAAGPSRQVSRRVWVWPALAAAAAVFLVVGPGVGRKPPRTPPGTSAHVAQPTEPTASGADVVRIDVEGAKSYTVMQVPGTVEGTTTAVVWIQDEPEDIEGSTQ